MCPVSPKLYRRGPVTMNPLKPDGNYIDKNHPIFKANVPIGQNPHTALQPKLPPVNSRPGLIDDSAPNLADVLGQQPPGQATPPSIPNPYYSPDNPNPWEPNDVPPGSIPPGATFLPINPPGWGGPPKDGLGGPPPGPFF